MTDPQSLRLSEFIDKGGRVIAQCSSCKHEKSVALNIFGLLDDPFMSRVIVLVKSNAICSKCKKRWSNVFLKIPPVINKVVNELEKGGSVRSL